MRRLKSAAHAVAMRLLGYDRWHVSYSGTPVMRRFDRQTRQWAYRLPTSEEAREAEWWWAIK